MPTNNRNTKSFEILLNLYHCNIQWNVGNRSSHLQFLPLLGLDEYLNTFASMIYIYLDILTEVPIGLPTKCH